MSVGVVVPNNIWVLELHRLPIDAQFYILATSIQGYICCYQHHGVIWILHPMNMKFLVINYYINVIGIAYLLPRKVLICRLSIKVLCSVLPF